MAEKYSQHIAALKAPKLQIDVHGVEIVAEAAAAAVGAGGAPRVDQVQPAAEMEEVVTG